MSDTEPGPVDERTVAAADQSAVPPERGLTPVEALPLARTTVAPMAVGAPSGWWPALRTDLAPLVPPVRRVVTVMAMAAAADWAVRAAGRRLVSGRVPSLSAPPLPARRRSETIIVERVIIHRS